MADIDLRPWLPLARALSRDMERHLHLDSGELRAAALLGIHNALAHGTTNRGALAASARWAMTDQVRDEYGRVHHTGRPDHAPRWKQPVPIAIDPTADQWAAEDPDLAQVDDHDQCEQLLGCLRPRHAHVLRRIYLDDLTAVTVAEELGCSQARVSQIRQQALARARANGIT